MTRGNFTLTKPVLLLTFNRPEITRKVFDEIKKVKPPRLYVSSDAARVNIMGEEELVAETRKIVTEGIDWKCKLKTKFNTVNHGCRKTSSDAISWLFEKEIDGIILEDDDLPSDSFFYFCQEMLDYYKNNKKVMHIAGHNFSPNYKDKSSYFFTKIPHSWGWATWADRWQHYGNTLKNYNVTNVDKFSNNLNVRKYWADILEQMKEGKIDSWAYQWMFKIVEKNGLCLNPAVNLVSNIGFGENATHTTNISDKDSNVPTSSIKNIIHPSDVGYDEKAIDYIYKNHYRIYMDDNSNKLIISIVIPSFNQGKFIERTIESVLGQKYIDVEIIVIDGGSTDGTVEILKKYGDKIKWISEKDNGQTEAINKGMRMATGEIMAYLNSDDTYETDTLHVVSKYFEENPKAMIVCGKGRHIDENDKYINDYPTEKVDVNVLKIKCPICQPTVFWRRKLWEDIGDFNEKLNYAMDYQYWLRVAEKYDFYFIDEYLANTRLHEETKTLSQKEEVAEEIIKIHKNLFEKVDDTWILNYIGEKYGNDKKVWIKESFKMIWKVNRRLPSLKTWKIYLTWIKELIS